MPELSDSIPTYVFYESVLSEFFRIARCTDNSSGFVFESWTVICKNDESRNKSSHFPEANNKAMKLCLAQVMEL